MQETEDKEGVYLQSFSAHRDMLYYARRVFMDEAFEIVKTGIDFFCNHLVFFNMLFAIVIVFFQRRDPKSVWAWLLLLYFIPVLGFVFYLLLGQDMHKRKMFRIKEVEDHISKDIRQQEYRDRKSVV